MRQALWPSAPGEHAGEIADFFGGMIDEPMQVLVAVDEAGGVVGMVELSIRRAAEGCFSDRVAYVEGWFVEPKFRRRGIGAALVRAAEVWARDQGCVELASDTDRSNDLGAAAHRGVGFVEIGATRCYVKSLQG